MAVKPIPKRLLPHQISYEEYSGEGRYGETWAPPAVIKRVRIEPSSGITKSASGEDRISQSILFVDAKHSNPAISLKVGSKVSFNGEGMIVNKVDPHYANGPNIHHWECELI